MSQKRRPSRASRARAAGASPPSGPVVAVFTGADLTDDTFSNDVGTWNVTRALRDCVAGKHGKPWRFEVAPTMRANAGIEVEAAKVRAFLTRPDILTKPLIVVLDANDGNAWLIDGHHRLRALHQLGIQEFAAFVIEAEFEPDYRVLLNGRPITIHD